MGSTIHSLEAYGTIFEAYLSGDIQKEYVNNLPAFEQIHHTSLQDKLWWINQLRNIGVESDILNSYIGAFVDVANKASESIDYDSTNYETFFQPGLDGQGTDFDWLWSNEAKDRLHIIDDLENNLGNGLVTEDIIEQYKSSLADVANNATNSSDYSSENYQSFFRPGLDSRGNDFEYIGSTNRDLNEIVWWINHLEDNEVEQDVIDAYTSAYIDLANLSDLNRSYSTEDFRQFFNPGLDGKGTDFSWINASGDLEHTLWWVEHLENNGVSSEIVDTYRNALTDTANNAQTDRTFNNDNYEQFFSPGLDGEGTKLGWLNTQGSGKDSLWWIEHLHDNEVDETIVEIYEQAFVDLANQASDNETYNLDDFRLFFKPGLDGRGTDFGWIEERDVDDLHGWLSNLEQNGATSEILDNYYNSFIDLANTVDPQTTYTSTSLDTFFNSDISDVETSVLEVIFEGQDLGDLVENGIFQGDLSLLDKNGNAKQTNLTGLISPEALRGDNGDWEQSYEILHVLLPGKAEDGDVLVMDGDNDWTYSMKLPLYMETSTEVDHSDDNQYFQLGILSGKNRYEINGDEEEEGLIDFNQQQIVLDGIDHNLENGDLIGFYWHETLPESIRSHHAYRVDSLIINSDYNRTTFRLIDSETSEDLLFSDTRLQQKINQHKADEGDSGLRMWRAELRDNLRVDHEAVIYEKDGDQFSETAQDPTSHLEVVFEAPNLDDVIENGKFSGSIQLIGDDGSTKAENIQAMLHPDAWINETKDEWETNYTRLHLFIPIEAADGDSLVIGAENAWNQSLTLPLYEETTAEVDNSFRNDYFQLGAKINKQRHEIKGYEAEEGYLDFDQDTIIISGVDHELNVGDLLGFDWHETLPWSIESYYAYQIEQLTTNNVTNETTISLIDPKHQESVEFESDDPEQQIEDYRNGNSDHGLRIWRAKERHYIALDHNGVTYQSTDAAAEEDAYEKTSLIEVVFKAKDFGNLVSNGGFTGSISLLDPEGAIKSENLKAVVDPHGFTDDNLSSWEQENERLYIYMPEKAQAGDTLRINGGDEWEKDLNLPLSSEQRTEVDYSTRNDYIQLGIKTNQEVLTIKGEEEQEGFIDLDDKKIILEGIENYFQNDDLIGFDWHSTLPQGLDEYKPYQIINLETEEDTNITSFDLFDQEEGEVVDFSDDAISQTIKNYNSGDRDSGLRLWKAKQEEVIRLDPAGAYYEIDGQKLQADAETNNAKIVEVVFDGKFAEGLVTNGRFTGSITLQNSDLEVREKNNIRAENLPALINYSSWTDNHQSDWDKEHERLHVMLPFSAEAGDILVIDGGDHWNQQLLLPFHNTIRTEVDRSGNDDYFQLNIKFKETIHSIKGAEKQEGHFDFGTHRIVLTGIDHELSEGDLIGFDWHETLPESVQAYKGYQVNDLKINPDLQQTSFKLFDRQQSMAVSFASNNILDSITQYQSADSNDGLRMWKAIEEEYLEFDQDAYRKQQNELSDQQEASSISALEINFKAKDLSNIIDEFGVFDGTISLVNSSGQLIDDEIAGLIQSDFFYRNDEDYSDDSWENTHERLEIFLGSEISDGDKLILDANQHWDNPLELPLHLNSFTETDHGSENAFQLGIRSAAEEWRLNVPGNEEQEGWLDLDNNQVVLIGVDHDIVNGSLMDFNWHEVLPQYIRSYHPYRVDDLTIDNSSNITTFKLIDSEDNRNVQMFDANIFERWSWNNGVNQGGIGLKIAESVVNERMELNWNEYEKLKRQREADRDTTELAAVEIVFKSEDMSEHFDVNGNFKGNVSLVDANDLVLEDNVTTMRDANAYFNEAEGDWQREHEVALSFFSSDIPEGSKILFEFEESSTETLEIGPLVYETRALSDHWNDDAFQLDVRVNGNEYTLPGREDSEGYLDVDMNKVVLNGTTLEISEGMLIDFNWHDALPYSIDEWRPYQVSELTINTKNKTTSFGLIDTRTGESITIDDTDLENRSDNFSFSNPEGLRLAEAEVENYLTIDWDASTTELISLSEAVAEDLKFEARNPEAQANDHFYHWTALDLATAKASYNQLRLELNPSTSQDLGLEEIPSNWDLRISYDDLISEDIPIEKLEGESSLHLFFDKELFESIFNTDNGLSVSLQIGPNQVPSKTIKLDQIENLNSIEELLQSLLAEEKQWLSESSATYLTTTTTANNFESSFTAPMSIEAGPGYHSGQQYRNKLLADALYIEPDFNLPYGFEASGITSVITEDSNSFLYIISDDSISANQDGDDNAEFNLESPSQLLRINRDGKHSPAYFTLPNSFKGESVSIDGEAITYDINSSTLYILDEGDLDNNRQSKIFSFSLNENGDIIETNGVSDIVRIETIPDTSEESDNQHESLVFLSESDSILVGEQKSGDVYEYDFRDGVLGSELRIIETGINDLRDLAIVTRDGSDIQYLAALHGKSAVINGEKNNQGLAYIQLLDLESGENINSGFISGDFKNMEGMTFSANEFIFTSDNGSSQEGATYKIRFDDLFPQDDNSETASSLFFSEYTTGYGSNKYIEIFNPTSSRVELDNYAFPTISNNTTTWGIYEFWNEFPEGATIESGDVYLIADPGAEPAILDQADHLFEYLGDGDDSFALVRGDQASYTVIDWLGNFDDRGPWDVAGTVDATEHSTLVRKEWVVSGNDNWDSARGHNEEDSEWLVLPADAFLNPGQMDDDWSFFEAHIMNDNASTTNQIENPGLRLHPADDSGGGLNEFIVDLKLTTPDGDTEQIYNAIWFGEEDSYNFGQFIDSDPDGFSVSLREWDSWENDQISVLKVDRYGDNLNRLSVSEEPVQAFWSDYHPQIWIEGNPFVAWDQQRISPRLINLEGDYFDIGDDVVLRFNLEVPHSDGPHDWSEWRDYAIIFDLHYQSGEGQLSQQQREDIFFDELYQVRDGIIDELNYQPKVYAGIEIDSDDEFLEANDFLDLILEVLRNVGTSANSNETIFSDDIFEITNRNQVRNDHRNLVSANLDFTAPQGGSKPQIDLWAWTLHDPSNEERFREAEDRYHKAWQTYEEEWVMNVGSIKPTFEWGYTDPSGEDYDSNKSIYIEYQGLYRIAEITNDDSKSNYKEGDIILRIDDKLVDPSAYSTEIQWGHRLKLRLKDDSGLTIKPKSTITFALQEGHGLRDVEGESIVLKEPLKIDNWARYEQFGYDLDEWISLNPDESFVEGKKATLSFHSKADLTDDSTKAVIPEISDFQFWSWNPQSGEQTQLQFAESTIEVKGKKLIFDLSNKVPSGVNIDVTYDPIISTLADGSSNSEPFTNVNGATSHSFHWHPIENISPDEEGPSVRWADVHGNRLYMGLDDPAEVHVNGKSLTTTNLPNPINFLITAGVNDDRRSISANSIRMNEWGDLELQLESSVQANDEVSLSYLGTALTDGLGNATSIRNLAINNFSVEFDINNPDTWFNNIDSVNVVFKQTGNNLSSSNSYMNDNGSLSSKHSDFQIADHYNFHLDEISNVSFSLTDQGGRTLDDEGDANLDFFVENITPRFTNYIGGSHNSALDSWKDSPSNDERNVVFTLPEGDYRLIIEHASLDEEIQQPYQLTIETTAFDSEALDAIQIGGNDEESFSIRNNTLNLSDQYADETIAINSDGIFTLAILDYDNVSSEVWFEIFDLNGQWWGNSYDGKSEQYLPKGLYTIEYFSSGNSGDIDVEYILDTTTTLETDQDTSNDPSGSLAINGMASQGKLNSLDTEDYWSMKLTGGEIYTVRATDFSQLSDVSLLVDHQEPGWHEGSWNWGTEDAETGVFTPSDETVVIDLSSDDRFEQNKVYNFIANLHSHNHQPTSYSLLIKSHDTLENALLEATKNIASHSDIFESYFGDASNLKDLVKITKDDLADLAALPEATDDELKSTKAKLEKDLGEKGEELSGNPLIIKSTLKTGSGETGSTPILMKKQTPENISGKVNETNKAELAANQSGELRQVNSSREFTAKDIASLADATADEVDDLKPISKPVDLRVGRGRGTLSGFLAKRQSLVMQESDQSIAVESDLDDEDILDLGLQRIEIDLSDEIRAQLEEGSQSLVWYRRPANADPFIYTYDEVTGTGALLEDTDPSQRGADVLALYVRDGARGDDDGLVNGEITSPGGLALVSRDVDFDAVVGESSGSESGSTTDDQQTDDSDLSDDSLVSLGPKDIDADDQLTTLTDGLALARRFITGRVSQDPIMSELASYVGSRTTSSDMIDHIDASVDNGDYDMTDVYNVSVTNTNPGSLDITDVELFMRFTAGTFPGQSITSELSTLESI